MSTNYTYDASSNESTGTGQVRGPGAVIGWVRVLSWQQGEGLTRSFFFALQSLHLHRSEWGSKTLLCGRETNRQPECQSVHVYPGCQPFHDRGESQTLTTTDNYRDDTLPTKLKIRCKLCFLKIVIQKEPKKTKYVVF